MAINEIRPSFTSAKNFSGAQPKSTAVAPTRQCTKAKPKINVKSFTTPSPASKNARYSVSKGGAALRKCCEAKISDEKNMGMTAKGIQGLSIGKRRRQLRSTFSNHPRTKTLKNNSS